MLANLWESVKETLWEFQAGPGARRTTLKKRKKLPKWKVPKRVPVKKQPQKKDQDIINLETTLTNQLGAKVIIKHNQAGAGTLTISYTSIDELEGILNKIK